MGSESLALRIRKVFLDCLYQVGEVTSHDKPPEGSVVVDGIMSKFAFHPKRLELHRQDVKDFLEQMPVEFQKSGGGGWSFLNLCMDKNGLQWCDLHQTMEQLVVLGMGLGMVEYCLPRELWSSFPGGMPYIAINTEAS